MDEALARQPTEGEWFLVDPGTIDKSLFTEEKANYWQEQARRLICQAFEEIEDYKPFEVMTPPKTWESKTVGELMKLAEEIGDRMAMWYEQALLWAQMLQNGETWEELCNKKDPAPWGRLVIWKDGRVRIIGTSNKDPFKLPQTDFSREWYKKDEIVFKSVPSVVRYKTAK